MVSESTVTESIEWSFFMEFLATFAFLGLGVFLIGQIIRGGADLSRWLDPAERKYGHVNPQLFCPHCESKGNVRTKGVVQKVGISGGKATAAILTGGLSMLATGLSRKQNFTQAHCDNCNCTWAF